MPLKISILTYLILIIFGCNSVSAQGSFSGDLELNGNFYNRDTTIGAAGLPHYDNLKSSADAWLSLNYLNSPIGLEAGVRFDMHINSILHEPSTPFTGLGIGRWYIKKDINDLKITGGYFYDQFGSGIIFRSYEERPLGIDNAILGIHLDYDIHESLRLKAFAGVQKNRFDFYQPFVKGVNADMFFSLSDKVQILPGAAALNRTLDEQSMSFVVNTIETYDSADRFVPQFNTYAMSIYNTLNVGDISWFIEGAYKTKEAIVGSDGETLMQADGNVIYSSLSFSKKGFGITGQFKRTENFPLRTSPNEKILDGMLNFIPPISRQNSLRLPARYNASTQELEEIAWSGDITMTPVKGYSINLSYSEIRNFNGAVKYFRELYADVELKKFKKHKGMVGFQYMKYNQQFYENKGDSAVIAYTPFIEWTYKFDRKKSIRGELQYQNVRKDFGQWIYGLAEFSISPSWSFSVSDMWNFDPNPKKNSDDIHYYSIFASYTHKSHRFSANYVKQVEGIVCTGGICRFEPAFSGLKLGILSSF